MTNPKIPWGYEGKAGPANWGVLDARFKLCDLGRAQSPIDLSGKVLGAGDRAGFHYRRTAALIQNDGRSLHVELRGGGSILLGDERYFLKQFHFHTPSEHALKGEFFPMEVHLVHSNRTGDLAVVGIFVREGQAHDLVEALWAPLPLETGESFQYEFRFNAADLLPAGRSHFRYRGSLTTPPCSENVRWLVFDDPIELSRKQIMAFSGQFNENRRPLQPLNGREITYFRA